ncbi:LuxR C-terminal-related transcriptional regulator [Streptomyces sp. NPDC001404]|uniref:LuxR C-terminal-related transcriptional regulator n=1 Tax=Streptomyces sp. NPDC001404 TaxID=3364571 RepID=UPI0036BC489C
MEIKEIPSSVLSRLPVVVWTVDRDLHLTSHIDGLGLDHYFPSPSVIVPGSGRSSYDLAYVLHPDVSAHLRARQGEVVSWRTGPEGSVVACVGPIHGPDATITGVVGVAIDQGRMHDEITRRQRMERLLYSVLGAVPALVSVLDGGGHVVCANREYLEALGRSESEVLGCSENELFRQCMTRRQASTLGERRGEFEGPYGVTEWVNSNRDVFRFRKIPLCGESGMLLHVASKVNGSVASSADLAAMAARCEELLGAIDYPAFICNSLGVIGIANKEWCTVLGAPQREVVGSPVLRWTDPSSVDSLRLLWGETEATPFLQSQEVLFKGKGGGAILATLTAAPLTQFSDAGDTLLIVRRWGDPAAHLKSSNRVPEISELDARILELLAVGKANAEIARSLCLSRQGLDYRLKNLRKQLGATSRGALVARAYVHGLLKHEDWPPRCCHST